MPFELGFFLGMSLIISIGAQNLFVIKQGLKKQHSLLVPTLCTISDASLILLSVFGLGTLISHLPIIKEVMLLLATLFLTFYGGHSLYRGINKKGNAIAQHSATDNSYTYWKIITITLAFSLLNPQAIIEMTVVMGGIANHYHNHLQWQFVAGAIVASLIWFFVLTWVSRLFSTIIVRPNVWRVMEILSGIIMILIAISCIHSLIFSFY